MSDNPDRWLMECAIERLIVQLARAPEMERFFFTEMRGAADRYRMDNKEGVKDRRMMLEQSALMICNELFPELRR